MQFQGVGIKVVKSGGGGGGVGGNNSDYVLLVVPYTSWWDWEYAPQKNLCSETAFSTI